MPDPGDTEERFRAYYQAALDKGADPLVLLFVMVILVGLFVLALKFWLDYRTKVARIRAGYSPEPDEERDSKSSQNTSTDVTALKLGLTKDLITEMLSPLLTLLADNTTAIRELAANLVVRDSDAVRASIDHTRVHRELMGDTGEIKQGLGGLADIFTSGYKSIMQTVVEAADSPIKVGVVFIDKEMKFRAWNREGAIIFGKGFDAEGKLSPLTSLGAAHSKGLGRNSDLETIIETAHDARERQIDVLELSVSGTDEGKWNWYLLAAFPFATSTLLLLLDIGDISRGALPKIVKTEVKSKNKDKNVKVVTPLPVEAVLPLVSLPQKKVSEIDEHDKTR